MTDYFLDRSYTLHVDITLLVIYSVIFFPCALLFFLRRDHHPIKLRGYGLVLFHTFVPFLELLFRAALGKNCYVLNARSFLTIPIWIYPYFFRALNLWYRYNDQQLMAKQTAKFLSPSSSPSPQAISSKTDIKEKVLNFLHRHPFLLSWKFAVIFFTCEVLFYLPPSLLLVFLQEEQVKFETCDVPNCFPFYAVPIGGALILILVFIYLLWGVKDPFLMKHEMSVLFIVGVIIAPCWAAAFIFQYGLWDRFSLGLIEICYLILSLVIPLIGSYHFSKWIKFSKLGQTSDQNISISFEREYMAVMGNPVLSVSFEEFTREAWSSENLLFVRMVDLFRQTEKEEERMGVAKDICEVFVMSGSRCEVNLEWEDREEILSKYHAKNVTLQTFDVAYEHCFNLLRYSVFPLWKQSSRFKDCLKKLKMASIQEYIELRESLELERIDSTHKMSVIIP